MAEAVRASRGGHVLKVGAPSSGQFVAFDARLAFENFIYFRIKIPELTRASDLHIKMRTPWRQE